MGPNAGQGAFIHTHTPTQTQFTDVHFWDMRENRSTHRKPTNGGNVQTTQTVAPLESIIFSQHYNETILNKMILLEDLLYIYFPTLMVSFPLLFYLSSFL